MWVQSLGLEDPLEKEMEPAPLFLPEKSHDRGAWWATIYGIAKSQTRLRKQTSDD